MPGWSKTGFQEEDKSPREQNMMVQRPIFLGLAVELTRDLDQLRMCITINDGFFVIGSKTYSFPIISRDKHGEKGSPSSGLSPILSMDSSQTPEEVEAEDEEDIAKGMHIGLEKQIVLERALCKKSDMPSPGRSIFEGESEIGKGTKLKCECVREETEGCLVDGYMTTKLSPTILRERVLDVCTAEEDEVHYESIEEEGMGVLGNVIATVLEKWICEYAKGTTIKIVAIGLPTRLYAFARCIDRIKNILWEKHDILPCFFTGGRRSLDQQSDSMARKCIALFGPENIPRLSVEMYNRIRVDAGHISFCSLENYRPLVGKDPNRFFGDLLGLVKKTNKHKISFISSTPQGGGVALMRHSLVRFFQMVGLDASWYVCVPSPAAFNITKRRFHNVLQAVAPRDVRLRQEDKDKVDRWIKMNYKTVWRPAVSASSIVVLDDHQVARLVPLIREDNKDAKIIYRSHIQIRSELMAESERMREVWEYLWEALQDVDYFVSHPIRSSVPASVPREKIIYNPAGTDPLDGLNKPLSESVNLYYQNLFNRICIDNGETPVDFSKMYIVQVARFDPSKGIPDLLESFYQLYQMHKGDKDRGFNVGLVICGHGSVDDPDGSLVFEELSQQVASEKMCPIRHLITKVRLPPSDQLLNMILQNARACCQLSTSEGFEVKVTESLMKKVPVIVYRSGGLPLQVKHGRTGFIADVGDIFTVAKYLDTLLFDTEAYIRMKAEIEGENYNVVSTPFQAMFWMEVFSMADKQDPGNEREIYKEFQEKYFR